jgi:predicted acyl esterase
MCSLLGDILSTDPERKSSIQSFLRWALVKCSKAITFVPWALVKVFNRAMLFTFPSKRQAPADLSGIDDGRYDYGLSQPEYGIKFERKVKIPMRDGTKLIGDVFRPDAPGRFPVIMAEAPYPRYMNYQPGVDDSGGVGTKYQQFEQADLDYWIPRGYVYVSFNTRGYGGSKGKTTALDYQEFLDFYDAIEWAAAQPWNNGNIGLYGNTTRSRSTGYPDCIHPI